MSEPSNPNAPSTPENLGTKTTTVAATATTATTAAVHAEGAIAHDLVKAYVPREIESAWYSRWNDAGVFHAVDDPTHTRVPFCIVIPPPNVTGSLHVGHALFATIQDVYTRHARMQGQNALWLPGTDHAGIATQVVVERILKREGTDRHKLGRDPFLSRVWQWKRESGGAIYEQLKVLGSSLDWPRERFTMDDHMSAAVREAFVRLYEEGLVYRAERLVNWSVGAQTVLSDLEIDQNEEDGELFDFAYVLVDDGVSGVDGGLPSGIVVSTTRPATMLGDTAVAVHPDDPRYRALIGRMLKHPFVDRMIPIVGDAILVDPKFGTGAVKVTPAHDANDFATGKRHNLPMVNVLNKDGTMNELAGEFAGMDRALARKAVKKRLDALGFARGTKKHRLAVPRCQRTHTVIEPMLSDQWYVKTKPLAAKAIEAVNDGRTEIVPAEWKKTYMHWMTNIEDWCISRQLWWGHQIPAWHCAACKGITVARETPKACGQCASIDVKQDDDVLDTWFSSGLWPFATLGWPEQTPALATFYPTTIMETGFDILFFWVARMMMFGLHFMGDVPFKKVFLHGMVTDEKGDKMSKVKGNVIDPLDVVSGIDVERLVEKVKAGGANDNALKALRTTFAEGIPAYGADALRWTLATYPPQQRKIPLSVKRIEGGRHFCNKLWNATRFALPLIAEVDRTVAISPATLADRWILSRLCSTTDAVHDALDAFRLDDATSVLYRFFWNEVCDWYLELVKPILSPKGGATADLATIASARQTLAHVLDESLRLMHPFIPFVTEELWQKLPRGASDPAFLALARVGQRGDGRTEHHDAKAESEMKLVQEIVSAIRTIRSEHEVHPAAMVEVRIRAESTDARAIVQREAGAIRFLAKTSDPLHVEAFGLARPSGFSVSSTDTGAQVLVMLKGLVEGSHEAARIDRELRKIEKDVAVMEKKLSQPSFTDKAPSDVVADARLRLDALRLAYRRLEEGTGLIGEL
ncbi:MAG: valine--tRNA ligase [Polyangiales bacterium]